VNPFTLRGYAMKEAAMREYKVKHFQLKGLNGISDLQIETGRPPAWTSASRARVALGSAPPV